MTTNLQNEDERGFICEAAGPPGLFGVFEDDGDTGYLYVYEPEGRGVVSHLHIYDRNASLDVTEADVHVEWSSDMNKCGVIIWSKFRGIINVATMQEGRVWMESRQTPGIADKTWLAGFIKS